MRVLVVGLAAGCGRLNFDTTDAAPLATDAASSEQLPQAFTEKSAATNSAGPMTNCDLVIDLPPGVGTSDLLLGMIYTDGGVNASISTPGFTRLTLDSATAVAFFKVVQSTEPSKYTFSIVAGTATSDTCAAAGVLLGVRDVDPTNPIDDDSASLDFGASLTVPSVTATIPTTIIGVFGSNGPGSGIAVPSEMESDPDPMPNGSFAISDEGFANVLITWQTVEAGASGARTTSIEAPHANAAGLIALRPLGAAGSRSANDAEREHRGLQRTPRPQP